MANAYCVSTKQIALRQMCPCFVLILVGETNMKHVHITSDLISTEETCRAMRTYNRVWILSAVAREASWKKHIWDKAKTLASPLTPHLTPSSLWEYSISSTSTAEPEYDTYFPLPLPSPTLSIAGAEPSLSSGPLLSLLSKDTERSYSNPIRSPLSSTPSPPEVPISPGVKAGLSPKLPSFFPTWALLLLGQASSCPSAFALSILSAWDVASQMSLHHQGSLPPQPCPSQWDLPWHPSSQDNYFQFSNSTSHNFTGQICWLPVSWLLFPLEKRSHKTTISSV